MKPRVLFLVAVVAASIGCNNSSVSGARPRCGDGHVDPGEACDDGSANAALPDACRENCLRPTCGDGIRDTGEECDEGTGNSDERPGACRSGCVAAHCGDGVEDEGEECDDGAGNSDERPGACRSSCLRAHCGDGVEDEGEECDDGAGNSDVLPDACRTSCSPASCGDGVLDLGETCDDGPANSDVEANRCRSDCTPSRCGDGVRDAGEGCDAGAANDDRRPGACRTGCVVPRCGDGVTDPGEECDAGEEASDTAPDTCRTTCVRPSCGDGVVDGEAGETCDDADDDRFDGCHECVFHVDYCQWESERPVDATGGAPWSGEELLLEDTLVGAANRQGLPCVQGGPVDRLFALPIPRAGNLVVRVRSVDGGFTPAVGIRPECARGSLACVQAPGPGEEAVAVAGVTPADQIRWFVVEAAAGAPGPFEVRLEIVPTLPPGAACAGDETAGSCAEGLVCHDPDADGLGSCVRLLPVGEDCDPPERFGVCTTGLCVCEVAGCTTGTCRSTCGDEVIQPWEECDDGEVLGADNCTPECLLAGRSCETPFRLDLEPGPDGRYQWEADTTIGAATFTASCGHTGESPELYGAFTAPSSGDWVFRLEVPRTYKLDPLWAPVLSVVGGSCASRSERACADSSAGMPTVRLRLAQGETVWPIVDGDTQEFSAHGPFSLAVQRVTCGDGVVGLGEECDDGNSADDDNCRSDCSSAGTSCTNPWTLAWDGSRREAVWSGWLSRGTTDFGSSCGYETNQDLIARFVAPTAGRYSFVQTGDRSTGTALSLRNGAACTTATELACRHHVHSGSPRVLVRELAAGEVVWVVLEQLWKLPPETGAFTLRVKPLVCGDGEAVLPEECDDGNPVAGDGCSSTCTLEAAESEPNNLLGQADPVGPTGLVTGRIGADVDPDWFAFSAIAGLEYTFRLYAGMVGGCGDPDGSGIPGLDLELFDDHGQPVGTSLRAAPAACYESVWTAPATGTYYLRVLAAAAGEEHRYFLEVR